MNKVQIAILVVLGAALALSVVTDLRSRKILNVVTFPSLLLCLGLRAAGGGWGPFTGAGLASGLLGTLLGGGFFLLMMAFIRNGMGWGDIKLMAAVGAGVGFPVIVACVVFIGLVGGVEAVAVLVWKGRLLSTFRGMGRSVLEKARLAKPEEREHVYVPYGVAIALGTVWGVVWSMMQAEPSPMQ